MQTLLQLQDIDLRIQRLREREREIPNKKQKFEIQRKRLTAELQEREDRLKRLQVEQRENEGDIEVKQQQIRKYEGQLLGVKKNEEYKALLHEIDMLKKQIGLREERILTIMIEVDEAKVHLQADRKRIDTEKAEIDSQCAEIDAELGEAIKERHALEASRDPVVKSVPHDLLAAYRRIRRKIETGPAVVPVSPGGDTCTGCHMTLRAQVANEVLAGKMHACSNCGRLVYNPESFSSSETVVEAGG